MNGSSSQHPDPSVGVPGSDQGVSIGAFMPTFPFHLVIDPQWRVVQVGRGLQRVAPELVPGALALDSLALAGDPASMNLVSRGAEPVMLELAALDMCLRGPVLAFGDRFVLLLEPWVTEADQPSRSGLSPDEFATRRGCGAEHRIAAHLRHMPLAVIDWDTEGRVVAWNPAAERIFGVTTEDAIGRGVELLRMVGPVDEPASDDDGSAPFDLLACLDRRLVVEHQSRADEPLLCAWHNTRLVDLDGRPIGVSSILRDVTESVRAERTQREAHRLESLGLFAGGMAHDVNNLLAALVGNLDLALLDADPRSTVARHLREIAGIAERATDLTKQLLEFSGQATPELAPVSMTELITQVRQILSVTLPDRVRLVVDQPIGVPMPEIEGDASRLRQVVGNLVINAAEAIPVDAHGEVRLILDVVTLTAEQVAGGGDPSLRGGPLTPGDYVRLSVADDGVGIEPGLLSRIFDPFFSTKFTGRGLGLAALLGIVRGHRGALRVESAPGQGTRFELYFPTRAPLALVPANGPVLARLGKGRLLVVDDEAQVRRVLTTALSGAGFDVIAASAGNAALELYDNDPVGFDLVLTDLTMPGLDGHELFSELTARDPRLPIILSSGFSDHQGTSCYPDGTPATFLKKPYRLGHLLAKVHEELGKRAVG